MGIDKKTARREFKERKTQKGIFALRCTASDDVWIGWSHDVMTAGTGVIFLLRNGMHHNKAMQAAWSAHGEPGFTVEVVEKFPEDLAAMTLRDLFRDRQRYWAKVLGAKAI